MDADSIPAPLQPSGQAAREAPGHASSAPATCANCETALLGAFCHRCGQSAAGTHRSVRHVVSEVAEELFSTDGRLWHTLRRLVLDPGRLTRDYLAGKRASQVAPLRLYVFVVFLLFVVSAAVDVVAPDDQLVLVNGAIYDPNLADASTATGWPRLDAWLTRHVEAARRNPELFRSRTSPVAEKLPLAMLPVAALVLSVLFLGTSRLPLYDHLIFSMHELTTFGLVLIALKLLGLAVGPWALVVFVLLPLNLYRHMRGAYATSVLGTLARLSAFGAAS